MKNKIEYNELSRAKVSESRNVVVSECSKGGFTIAQQLEVQEEGNKTITVFMKGAIHVDGMSGLYNLRDAVNLAIKLSEEGSQMTIPEWDQ